MRQLATLLLATTAIAGTNTQDTAPKPPATDNALTMERLGIASENTHSFFRDTKLFLNGRLRYEYADIEGLDSADALTLRNRFGFETGNLSGFSLLAEGEHTLDLGGTYAPFPGFNNGRSIIADPDNLQLNRLQLNFADEVFGKLTIGRQAINLGDQRFIGAVGWRQNDQTFDAASVTIDAVDHLTLTYAYINQINRIFGTRTPAKGLERWDSDSHLINLDTDIIPGCNLTAFAYLLDFSNAPASSSNTYGIDLISTEPIALGGTELGYHLTAAYQTDSTNNPADYDAWYFRAEGNGKFGPVKIGLGGELLGSDNGRAAVQTPLGTNHKFNGFADAFLITPAGGLHDYYASIGTTCPLDINHTVILHYFQSDHTGNHLGNEIDYVAIRKLNEHISITAKVAYLDGANSQPDTLRASVQLDYTF